MGGYLPLGLLIAGSLGINDNVETAPTLCLKPQVLADKGLPLLQKVLKRVRKGEERCHLAAFIRPHPKLRHLRAARG